MALPCGLGPIFGLFLLLSHEHMISGGLHEPGWKLAGVWLGQVHLGPEKSLPCCLHVSIRACAASSQAVPPQQGD